MSLPRRSLAQAAAAFALTLALAAPAAERARSSDGDPLFEREELVADLAQMAGAIRYRHPAPFAFIAREDFDRLAADIESRIAPRMSSLEFYRLAAPLAAATGCVHSYLSLPDAAWRTLWERGGRLPFQAALVDGRLYAISVPPGSDISAGSELLAIGGLETPELLARLRAAIAADRRGESGFRARINADFNYMYLQLVGPVADCALRLLAPDGTTRDLSIRGVASRYFDKFIRWKHLPPSGFKEFAEGVSYLRIADFEDYGFVAGLVESNFARLAATGARRLVLDLRGNMGGAPECGALLLSYLLEAPFSYFANQYPGYEGLASPIPIKPQAFRGELVVLMDGASSSTTGHVLAILAAAKGRAFLVGEESGGSYVCHDYGTFVYLNNTKLPLRTARRTVKAGVVGQDPSTGVLPDLEIEPLLSDHLAGRDAALEAALAVRLAFPGADGDGE